MIGIGFRAGTKEIYFATFDTELGEYAIDQLIVPVSLDIPARLRYVRTNLLDITSAYEAETAFLKEAEYHPRANTAQDRIALESVIQEMLSSSTVEQFQSGRIDRMAYFLGIPRPELTSILNGAKTFRDFESWVGLTKEEREATVAAVVATLFNHQTPRDL